MKQMERIKEMEAAMDRLSHAIQTGQIITPSLQNDYKNLSHYYETQWLRDYEADERGELPSDLKRGILSEDALYDLLSEIDERMEQD